jgi:hypothetical protein
MTETLRGDGLLPLPLTRRRHRGELEKRAAAAVAAAAGEGEGEGEGESDGDPSRPPTSGGHSTSFMAGLEELTASAQLIVGDLRRKWAKPGPGNPEFDGDSECDEDGNNSFHGAAAAYVCHMPKSRSDPSIHLCEMGDATQESLAGQHMTAVPTPPSTGSTRTAPPVAPPASSSGEGQVAFQKAGFCVDGQPLQPGQPVGVPRRDSMLTVPAEVLLKMLVPLSEKVPLGTHPESHLEDILTDRGYLTNKMPALKVRCCHCPSQNQLDSYDVKIVTAVRDGDIASLRSLYDDGRCMSACNKFGESIVHMACRRGRGEVLKFLLANGADVLLRDDYGRTPLHDACWSAEPHFEIVQMLLNQDLRLLRLEDARGSTALQYVREEHWPLWCAFFDSKKHLYWPHLEGGDVAGVLEQEVSTPNGGRPLSA